ncbi:ThuA domain-containing protein [Hamadaea tsunoensis]|uniref:ThuA domain-containing protein n=1 Tax=Hamadaea tsunoensis TaxID=53368 RepID=UPI000414051E|nr:ThuA domain-containing protein [Hamadaea tsunoensis]
MHAAHRGRTRLAALLALCLALSAVFVVQQVRAALAAPAFKVLAFYNGTYDAAHIDFDKEAKVWFPQTGAQYGFSWEATTDWSRLNATELANYKVIMFLDDLPPAGQRAAFQTYMQNGGGFLGFHVSAFTTDANSWSWYHNTFLGSGNFVSNSWGPTAETLKIEDRTHPSTIHLPATISSAVSEWYSWSNDLRTNPNIDILASMDQSTFPIGTDPNQTWYSGYYPVMWTNRNYKMLYANFGHNAMDYSTNTRLSSTFASAQQNQWLIDGLLWLGGASGTPSPSPSASVPASPSASPSSGPISPTSWYSVVNKNSSKCVDARSAASANGTAIQQYTCNATNAQSFQFQSTSGGYYRINIRLNTAQSLDVTNVSTADNAAIQLWAYGGGNNQQWLPVSEGGGYYHFVNRNSGKCLDVPGASTADSVQLVQYACNGTGAQSYRLSVQP